MHMPHACQCASNHDAGNLSSPACMLVYSGLLGVRRGILAENEYANKQTSDQDPYDQYEVSMPLSTAGDCFKLVRLFAAVDHT